MRGPSCDGGSEVLREQHMAMGEGGMCCGSGWGTVGWSGVEAQRHTGGRECAYGGGTASCCVRQWGRGTLVRGRVWNHTSLILRLRAGFACDYDCGYGE
jgi:hypothetical protein